MTPERLTQASDAELQALSDLCLRSKAIWGYDADFMEACRDVLRIRRAALEEPVAVVRQDGAFAGIVCLTLSGEDPELSKLFVCPSHLRKGVGSALMAWAKSQARHAGHSALRVESDPDAVPFYKAHGAVQVGHVPSEAIPNRMLPLLSLPTLSD